MKSKLHYKDFGDNYDQKDPLKVLAIKAAKSTSKNLEHLGYKEVAGSRGESTYLVDMGDFYLATNPEGLGTKNLVADEVAKINKEKSFYREVAIDTVATIVNDLITSGARPLVVNAHWSIGGNEFMNDTKRWSDLVQGWKEGCDESGVIYGGGESPTLRGIILRDKIELSGSVVGIIKPKSRYIIGKKLKAGDHIILIESNGIHANGVSMARGIAEKLPERYATKLSNGMTFGEALLKPSHIYAKLVEKLLDNGIDLHYLVHITGHGWSKIMRYAEKDFTYRITFLPEIPEEFKLLQKAGEITDEVMYGTYNMGAGFAFYVDEKEAQNVVTTAKDLGFQAWDAGIVEKGPRKVILEPLGLTYGEETLNLR